MNLRINRLFFICILLFLQAGLLAAHPHMFLDAGITVRANEKGVTGIHVSWEFDVWFSASIIMDFDFDENGKFDDYETSEIYDLAFSNLENYDYFTYFTADAGMIPASEVSEFSVRKDEDKIIYDFFIPFEVPFSEDRAKFSVAVYDKTFFCDVAYVGDRTAFLEGPSGMKMEYTIGEDEDITIEYDNAIVGNGRTGEIYSGVTHPDSIRIVVTK